MSPDKIDALIIGGGAAGLTAALHLAERGLRPLVLEADPMWAGGRLKGSPAAEFEHAGRMWRFRGEHGVHAIWSPYRNFQAMLTRHRIRPVLVPAQDEAWIHGDGPHVRHAAIGSAIRNSWIPAPLHYLGLFARPRFLAMLNVRDLASMFRVVVGLFAALAIDPLVEERALPGFTLADYCHKWSPTLIALFTGLTRNAIPAPLEEIPASGFIAFLRFYTLRRRDAWAFSYLPDDGGTSIVAPLIAKIQELGGDVRLGAKAVRVERFAEGWRVYVAEGGGSTARHLILATDAPATAALLHASPATEELAEPLHLPTGTPTAILRLWFSRQPKAALAEAGVFTGDFIADNFFWLHRIYNDYIAWSRVTGGSAIESHIYGPAELLEKPDAALLAQAIVDVGRAWPELKGHVIHSEITRNDPTHTLLDVGRPTEHLAVHTPWPHLFCCGDWVRDPNPALFLERASTTGIKAANAVLAERGLPPWPLLEHPEPEPLAAWIEQEMRAVRMALLRRRLERGDSKR